jgi:hypothetical protein
MSGELTKAMAELEEKEALKLTKTWLDQAETEPAAFLTSYSGRSKQGPKRDGPVAVTPTAPRGETINQGGASSSKM